MRRFSDNVDDKSRAAGVMPICAETGRFLLALRPSGVYSTIGGFLCWGEDWHEGAMREFQEETMYEGPMLILKGYTFQSPVKNFQYVNFIGICPKEFEPILDKENLEAEWFTLSQIYGGRLPLHHDFEEFTIEAKPLIDSMMRNLGILNA